MGTMTATTNSLIEFIDERTPYRISFTYIREGKELKHIRSYAFETFPDSLRGVTIYKVNAEAIRGKDVLMISWDFHEFYLARYIGGLWEPVEREYLRGLRISGSSKYDEIYRSLWPRLCSCMSEILAYEDLKGIRLSDDKTLKYFIDKDMGYWRCAMFPDDEERIQCLEELTRIITRDWLIVLLAKELGLEVIRFAGPTISYAIINRVGRLWGLRTDLVKEVIGPRGDAEILVIDLAIYSRPWPSPSEKPKLVVKIIRTLAETYISRIIRILERPKKILLMPLYGEEACSEQEDVAICGPLSPRSKVESKVKILKIFLSTLNL
jgi:hypothetical protein